MTLIPVTAKFDPLSSARIQFQIESGLSLLEIAQRAEGVPDIFFKEGMIAIDGHEFYPPSWPMVKPKVRGRRGAIVITMHLYPQGGGGKKVKNVALTIAAIAIVAGTAFIGAGGLAALGFGSTFAAGSVGASLAAAGFGIAGQLALSALAPPPLSGNDDQKDTDITHAGITNNSIQPLETLPGVLGRMLVSPPLLAPAYTILENGDITVHAVVGIAGHYDISNILINGVTIDEMEGVEYEIISGAPSSPLVTLADKTVIERAEQTQLSTFRLELASTKNDRLIHQDDPDSDLPLWHVYKTDGDADEFWFRLFFPGGIVESGGSDQAAIPIRVEFRPKGGSDWTKGPVFHVQDIRRGKQFRLELRFKWGNGIDGYFFSGDNEKNALIAYSITGSGQSFQYQADSYFAVTGTVGDLGTDYLPVMTAPTTSGVTMSASSENGANNAWRAADSGTNRWRSNANPSVGSPEWLKIDLGSALAFPTYFINVNASQVAEAPKDWTFQGSNDDTNWTDLSVVTDVTDWADIQVHYFRVDNTTPYRYYRWLITATNTPAGSLVSIMDVTFYQKDASLVLISGTPTLNNIFADNVRSHDDGFDIYLDEDIFPKGEYEFRIKRGLAHQTADHSLTAYTWSGNATLANYFEYVTGGGGQFIVRIGQSSYQSDTIVEKSVTYSNDYPLNVDEVAMIALTARNIQVEKVSAIFESIVPIWSGGVWSTEEPTRNPAALYRNVLLGSNNIMALPGEIIDEDALQDWYDWCVLNGYECNAVVEGQSVEQVLQLIAATGWSVPRQSDKWGVVTEKDTSGDPTVQKFTPLNSKNFQFGIEFPDLPHALRAEFFDEDDEYRLNEVIVYAEAYDESTATLIDSIRYEGFTNINRVEARALLDLRQLYYRRARYTFEVGIEHLVSTRGDLIGLNHDLVSKFHGYSIVKQVLTSGPNITGFVFEADIDFSVGEGDIDALEDIENISDFTAIDIPMAISLRKKDQEIVTLQVNQKVLTDTVTLTTPILIDSDIAVGCLVGGGLFSNVEKRCKIFSIEPFGDLMARITCLDEAPEIHYIAT